MPDPINRKLQMLQLIPRAPRKVDTATLERRLRELGFDVDRRTIQRDLVALSSVFPLASDERSKPFGWSWNADGSPLAAPDVDLHVALAFRVAAGLLDQVLPAATRTHLRPHFELARQRLDALQGSALRSWPDKIHVIPGGVRRTPPAVNPDVLDAVQSGLFEERCLELAYVRRGAEEPRLHRVAPCGLVYRDIVGYLVAFDEGFENPTQFALHRIRHVDVTDQAAIVPDGFSLDEYVAGEAFGFLLGARDLRLKAIFEPDDVAPLVEGPLSDDQVIVQRPDGRVLLEATVRDTTALRTWLLSYGARVEVVAPVRLRAFVRDHVKELSRRYRLHRATSG